MKEREEEKRRVESTEQALILSNTKRREERQSSHSFDWMHELLIEDYNNKQVESSSQQFCNADIIQMLARMEQRMKERDDQLRTQLQLRDEYFDAEINLWMR